MAIDAALLLADLRAETAVVEAMLTPLRNEDWDIPTPAAGWAIRDHISHLAYFDEAAALAAQDAAKFRAAEAELRSLGPNFPDRIAERYRDMPPDELRQWFHTARRMLIDVFTSIDPAAKLPWYGQDMAAASSVTARLMETWAHGHDIAETLGESPEPTARLRHIAHIGVRTLGHSFGTHGRAVPTEPVYVSLTAPDGELWTWGPPDAPDSVSGPALDFCLVVTRRRHVADTALHTIGIVAAEWMTIAQAYAGAPGPGRPPKSDVGQ
jgi:uncharacterized protein (TIGR03084 family)